MDLLLISECPPYPLSHLHRGLIYHLAAELSARRHVIDLLCFYDQPEDYAHVPRYSQYFRSVELIPHPEITIATTNANDTLPIIAFRVLLMANASFRFAFDPSNFAPGAVLQPSF